MKSNKLFLRVRSSGSVCICFFVMLLLVFSDSATVRAQEIIASVNGQIITTHDLDQRIRLLQLASGNKKSGDSMREAVLNELVDEQLIFQEAARLGIAVPDAQIAQALERIAAGTGNNFEQFTTMIWNSHAVGIETLKLKIKSQIIWQNILRSEFKRNVRIDTQKIDRFLEETGGQRLSKRYEYTLQGVVFLLVEGEQTESAVKQKWEEAQRFASSVTSCNSLPQAAAELRDVVLQNPFQRSSEDLPEQTRQALAEVSINGSTKPSIGQEGITFFVVCDKREIIDNQKARLEAQNKLANDEFSVFTRKYLQELQRNAIIERH